METIKRAALILWQLPQTILGLLVLLFTRHKTYIDNGVWVARHWTSNACFGEIIILRPYYDSDDHGHECGHREQSRMAGLLYLLLVGIPSAAGNLIDRWCHKSWTKREKRMWYYNLPWEADADERGGVWRW